MTRENRDIEWEMVEDVSKIFSKFFKERHEDAVSVQMGNHITSRGKEAKVLVMIYRRLLDNRVAYFSRLFTPPEFRDSSHVSKMCKDCKEYFDKLEYEVRNRLN